MTDTGQARNGATFGFLLREHRVMAALSQEALAAKSGLSTRAISDLERGVKTRPYLETVRRIADALDLSNEQRFAFAAASRRLDHTARVMSHPSSGQESGRPELPVSPTRLVGREEEVAAITSLLRDPDVRLVTLTGPGGIGKTRLALQAARVLDEDFDHGARFVGLADVAESDGVAATIARVLGVAVPGGENADVRLRVFLASRCLLLVLDNFEQVVAAGPLIADLLSGAPDLKVLVTSREPLHLAGEHELEVLPLGLPEADTSSANIPGERAPAIQLFLERARGVSADFAVTPENSSAVTAICRRLDGLPLAIELAAARVKVLSPESLLARMERPLPLLIGGARDLPRRQQTMRAAIAWSYDLLGTDEQAIFRRLAVFVGGFTLEVAEAVGEGNAEVLEIIASLADKSLLRFIQDNGPEPRYAMLETVREFGLEKLSESAEEVEVRDRHAAYFSQWVDQLDPVIAPYLPDGMRIFDRLEVERANLRVALVRLAETGETDALRRLASNLNYFWRARGDLRDGQAWLERAISLPGGSSRAALAAALDGLAGMLYAQGEGERAFAAGRKALDLARELEDGRRIALVSQRLGLIARRLSKWDEATAYQGEALAALAPFAGTDWADGLHSLIRGHLAHIDLAQGNLDGAEAKLEALFAQQRAIGREPGTGHAFANNAMGFFGDVARGRGELETALGRYRFALREARRYGEGPAVVALLASIAGVLAAMGEWERAARLFGATEAQCEHAGISFGAGAFDRQRALGLPEPWMRAGDAVGDHERLRLAMRAGQPVIPPIPDPERAAALWVAGRMMSTQQSLAEALAEEA